MNASDYAAWYAAVVATLALYLEFRRGRVVLKMWARGGMVVAGERSPDGQQPQYVRISVRHVQGPPTTINAIAIHSFSSRMQRLRRFGYFEWLFKRTKIGFGKTWVILNPTRCTLPARLEVGQDWNCFFPQEEFEKAAEFGDPFIAVSHVLGRFDLIAPVSPPRRETTGAVS